MYTQTLKKNRFLMVLLLLVAIPARAQATEGGSPSKDKIEIGDQNTLSESVRRPHELLVPANGHCLYTSIILGYLLPVVGHPDDFNRRLGRLARTRTLPITHDQLASHYHDLDYLHSDTAFQEVIGGLLKQINTEPGTWGGPNEIQLIAEKLNLNIQEYTPNPDHPQQLIKSDLTQPESWINPAEATLHIVQDTPLKEELVDADDDSDLQRGQRFSLQTSQHRHHYRPYYSGDLPQPPKGQQKNNDNKFEQKCTRQENPKHTSMRPDTSSKPNKPRLPNPLKVYYTTQNQLPDLLIDESESSKGSYSHSDAPTLNMAYQVKIGGAMAGGTVIGTPLALALSRLRIEKRGDKDSKSSSEEKIGPISELFWAETNALLFYEKELFSHMDTKDTQDGFMRDRHLFLGYDYFVNFKEALNWGQKRRDIVEKFQDPRADHLRIALSYHNLGDWYQNQGDYDQAEAYYTKAIKIYRKKRGENHPDIALSYNNLGNLYWKKGKYNQAEPYYTKALDIYEKKLGKDHLDTATSYNNLGNLYYRQGKYDQTETCLRSAIETYEQQLGKNHPDTVTAYNNLGNLYYRQGKYDQAKAYHTKALEIREPQLGTNHPDTATSYNNLGLLYYDQGDYDQAEAYHIKAIAIREQQLGKNHPDTATSYNNLGILYYRQGKYDQAEAYHAKAIAIREQQLGKNHPDTAISYNNLGILYSDQDRYDQAEPYLTKALDIRKRQLRKNHPDTATSYHSLGHLYLSQGKYDQAEMYLKTALDIYEEQLGKTHPHTVVSYNNLGSLYCEQGKYDEAEVYLKASSEIAEQQLGKDHPHTATSYENLGFLYQKQGKHTKAEAYYTKAIEIYEKTQGKNHPSTGL